jgi:uncharacterized protein YuzB (UPF0349 family)
VNWSGANFVVIDLVDSTQKFKVGEFGCASHEQKCTKDVAAGSYYLKIGTPGFDQLIPVTVPTAGTAEITPPAGVISMSWNGANFVVIDLVDSTQKFKVGEFGCASHEQKCTKDVKADLIVRFVKHIALNTIAHNSFYALRMCS